jgi:hypothetical protein
MRGRFATLVFLFAAALSSASAPAMSAAAHKPIGRCTVIGGEKLPAASGGTSAICAEVERAIAGLAPTARYSAEVRVLSSSRLAATLVVNGRKLPEQRFAIMDRELNAGAVHRFAQSLAAEVARAAKL